MRNIKELERSLKEVDPHWTVIKSGEHFAYCYYAGVKFVSITHIREPYFSFTQDMDNSNVDIFRAALPVIEDFIKPDDEKFFQPETTQDTCTYCHNFEGMHQTIGGISYDDGSELSVYITGHKIKFEYNSASLNGPDIDAKFDANHCLKCGRRLK